MTNYLLVYHGGAPSTPAELEASMGAWTAWFGSLGDAIVDGGTPVGAVRTLHPDGSVVEGATDRPTGYSILRADDLQGAIALASGCPLLAHGGRVEVAETIPM